MIFGCCAPSGHYDKVVSAGFSFIELAGSELAAMNEREFAELRDRISSGPIPCPGLNAYCRETPAIVGPNCSDKATVEYARLLAARGRELGVRRIGIGAPSARKLSPGYDPALARSQCGRFLTLSCEVFADYGIDALFEAVNDRSCDYATRTAEAVELVKELSLPNLHMVLDFYHMHVMGEDVLDIASALPYIRHTHISTCGAKLERGYPQMAELEYYSAILRTLIAGGYNGSMSVEAAADTLERDAAGTAEMLRRAEAMARER